ncbi:MAG: hypothetical protein QOE70_392 [Chthoniobacter sp.]|jgi:hypothetical protein|nr:hypothetical protein [Chthoniobacter sp.]
MPEYFITQSADGFMFHAPHGACAITALAAAHYVEHGIPLFAR